MFYLRLQVLRLQVVLPVRPSFVKFVQPFVKFKFVLPVLKCQVVLLLLRIGNLLQSLLKSLDYKPLLKSLDYKPLSKSLDYKPQFVKVKNHNLSVGKPVVGDDHSVQSKWLR